MDAVSLASLIMSLTLLLLSSSSPQPPLVSNHFAGLISLGLVLTLLLVWWLLLSVLPSPPVLSIAAANFAKFFHNSTSCRYRNFVSIYKQKNTIYKRIWWIQPSFLITSEQTSRLLFVQKSHTNTKQIQNTKSTTYLNNRSIILLLLVVVIMHITSSTFLCSNSCIVIG